MSNEVNARMRRALKNQPRTNTPLLAEKAPAQPARSPEEVEAAKRREDMFYASIAASIDFLYQASEDAFRQQMRRSLELK